MTRFIIACVIVLSTAFYAVLFYGAAQFYGFRAVVLGTMGFIIVVALLMLLLFKETERPVIKYEVRR